MAKMQIKVEVKIPAKYVTTAIPIPSKDKYLYVKNSEIVDIDYEYTSDGKHINTFDRNNGITKYLLSLLDSMFNFEASASSDSLVYFEDFGFEHETKIPICMALYDQMHVILIGIFGNEYHKDSIIDMELGPVSNILGISTTVWLKDITADSERS